MEYRLIRRFRLRGIRLSVGISGVLTVSAPFTATQLLIDQVLFQKKDWIEKSVSKMRERNCDALVNTAQDYKLHKKTALTLVTARIHHFNAHYQVLVNKINVRRQTSRWGSCSRGGSININYQVIRLPSELVDYVVVHELCHLRFFNHSAQFWQMVAEQIPNYTMLRARLRTFVLMAKNEEVPETTFDNE